MISSAAAGKERVLGDLAGEILPEKAPELRRQKGNGGPEMGNSLPCVTSGGGIGAKVFGDYVQTGQQAADKRSSSQLRRPASGFVLLAACLPVETYPTSGSSGSIFLNLIRETAAAPFAQDKCINKSECFEFWIGFRRTGSTRKNKNKCVYFGDGNRESTVESPG